ncbi:nickel transporter permease [Terribacillus halophilus]|uniref:nickel transporter permease n=1 Tax=Terribacillus halophilus TaxID=361279 RepID=UPI003982A6E4
MSVMALSPEKIKKTKVWLISALLVLSLAVAAYTFLYLKHDANMTDVGNRLASPSWEHPMGTDHLGRDVLTRLLLGFRLTVGYSLIALAAAVMIGVPFGLLAGIRGGWVDRLFMRIADGFLAFPDTVIAIVLSGLLGPGIGNLLFAIVLVKWVNYARMVRSTVLTEVQKDYITIARINGLSTFTIMRRHLMPHIIGNILVLSSLDFGKIILLISSLSYIGLGAQPPTPEWGAMLNESRPYFQANPEMMVYPGLAIVAVVLVANVLGDYLRDKFDVKKEVQP